MPMQINIDTEYADSCSMVIGMLHTYLCNIHVIQQ